MLVKTEKVGSPPANASVSVKSTPVKSPDMKRIRPTPSAKFPKEVGVNRSLSSELNNARVTPPARRCEQASGAVACLIFSHFKSVVLPFFATCKAMRL